MIGSIKKVEVKYDKDSINTVELVIHDESHTLANMIRDRILQNKDCTFCAYKMAHPSDKFVSVRVSSVETKPVRIMIVESLRGLYRSIDELIDQVVID